MANQIPHSQLQLIYDCAIEHHFAYRLRNRFLSSDRRLAPTCVHAAHVFENCNQYKEHEIKN